MEKRRRRFTAEEKVAILRRHLLEKAVAELKAGGFEFFVGKGVAGGDVVNLVNLDPGLGILEPGVGFEGESGHADQGHEHAEGDEAEETFLGNELRGSGCDLVLLCQSALG